MEEIWKSIDGTSGKYLISNKGRVWSNKSNKLLKQQNNGHGYLRVELYYTNGNRKKYLVHRLVADHFIPINSEKTYINHIDENKNNNSVLNLERCTFEYNINHGTRNKRMIETRMNSEIWRNSRCNSIIGINIETKEKVKFYSYREAEKYGFHSGHISDCVNGKSKTHKGYQWYKEEEFLDGV